MSWKDKLFKRADAIVVPPNTLKADDGEMYTTCEDCSAHVRMQLCKEMSGRLLCEDCFVSNLLL